MKTCKIMLTLTTKEPKICHALATTSAFNLKLCPIFNVWTLRSRMPKNICKLCVKIYNFTH